MPDQARSPVREARGSALSSGGDALAEVIGCQRRGMGESSPGESYVEAVLGLQHPVLVSRTARGAGRRC